MLNLNSRNSDGDLQMRFFQRLPHNPRQINRDSGFTYKILPHNPCKTIRDPDFTYT